MNMRTTSPAAQKAGLELSPEGLTRLQTWFSPSFPVGAFSYSHGLEWLVETDDVRDLASLAEWIEGVLRHGSGRSDAIFLCAAWRMALARDWDGLQEIAALAAALQPTAERRLESLGQGTAFRAAVAAAWPHPLLKRFAELCRGEVAAPIAVGVAGAAHELPLDALSFAFLQSFAANLVSAGVRLVPLGQTDGLRATAMLEPVIRDVARQALAAGLDEIGSAAILTDIASMRHELQYTRLFRS
jgi:urease accessory protein